jgi:ketosteroid isomerase-like protein
MTGHYLFLLLGLLATCTNSRTSPSQQANSSEQAIRQAMSDQEAAWDRGDIPGFMAHYSDTACFIGRKGRTCGRDAVTANYLKSYPDNAAMGDLSFGTDEVIMVGERHAWLTGTWTLHRMADTLGGGFSLFWVKEGEVWRIARDHTY